MTLRILPAGLILALSAGLCSVAAAQPSPAKPKRQPPNMPQPASKDDPKFQNIFDGKTLNGWEGGPQWRVEDGALVGETTQDNPLRQNTFIIWRGGRTADFELRLEYRLGAQGNSGIQYRSAMIPDRTLALRGYQADIDSENRYTGQIYEEGGRGFLALRGQATRIDASDAKFIVGKIGDSEQLQSIIRKGDWNECHIIARGNTVLQFINGQLMSALVDEDPKGRSMEGLLGLQLHVGPPMKIEFRSIRLKPL